MRAFVILALLGIGGLSIGGTGDRPSDKAIIKAFMNCPEIVSAQKEFEGIAEPEEAKILLYDSMCGVAGCQHSALVAQTYARRKADPMTLHILGRVHIDTKNQIAGVERVVLMPFEDLPENKDKVDKEAPSPE